jgi:glycosidase
MQHKIYQLFLRSFLNNTNITKPNGSWAENGSGTFSQINAEFIEHLKSLQVNVLWITGVIRHASTESWPSLNIQASVAELIKGKAGSPYAVTDYFDVNPYLASNPENRVSEFKSCVSLLKENGIKVIIDFVPNHVSRDYKSLHAPNSFIDFGKTDKTNEAWLAHNDFYYLPGQELVLPVDNKDNFKEFPAKATGNNCFKPNPNAHDWYETVKLNYGWNPFMPNSEVNQTPVWDKMLTVLEFWLNIGVDGFRCDMADMIPIEFWYWVLDKISLKYDNPIFIAESYSKDNYSYLIDAGFTLLYDKVGAYNCVEAALKLTHPYDLQKLNDHINYTYSFQEQMLRFSENHDETRLASALLAGNGLKGFAATALLYGTGSESVMLYNGQEFGEKAIEETGYSGSDGKSTIYDFATVPCGLRWINNKLSDAEKELYQKYALLMETINSPTFSKAGFYSLGYCNAHLGDRLALIFIWLRYYKNNYVLGIANLSDAPIDDILYLNAHSLQVSRIKKGEFNLTDLLQNVSSTKLEVFNNPNEDPYGKLSVYIAPQTTVYYQLSLNVE